MIVIVSPDICQFKRTEYAIFLHRKFSNHMSYLMENYQSKRKKEQRKVFFTKTNLAVNLFHLKVYSAQLYSVNTTKLASNTKSLDIFFPESIVEGGPYF